MHRYAAPIVVSLAAAAALAAACGGGSDVSPTPPLATSTARPPSTPPDFASGTIGDLAFCVQANGSVGGTLGRDICLADREFGIGDRVQLTIDNWDDDYPIKLSILTDEQARMSIWQVKEKDRIRLGEVNSHSGRASFEFTLTEFLETVGGDVIRIASGDKLFLMAGQSQDRGSVAHATSFTVK